MNGFDRYSFGIPLAFGVLFILDAVGVLPTIYSPGVTLMIFLAAILGFAASQNLTFFKDHRRPFFVRLWLRRVRAQLGHFSITLIGIVFGTYLYTPGPVQ